MSLTVKKTLLVLGLGFTLSIVPVCAETVDSPDAEDQTKSEWYLDLTLLGNMGNLAIGHDYGRARLKGGLYGAVETVSIGDYDLTAVISSFMLNAYSDLGNPDARWQPYIGLGAGYGVLVVTDGNAAYSNEGGFTYRISGGVSYALNKSWDANIMLGYQGLSVPEIGEVVGKLGGGLGLRYRF